MKNENIGRFLSLLLALFFVTTAVSTVVVEANPGNGNNFDEDLSGITVTGISTKRGAIYAEIGNPIEITIRNDGNHSVKHPNVNVTLIDETGNETVLKTMEYGKLKVGKEKTKVFSWVPDETGTLYLRADVVQKPVFGNKKADPLKLRLVNFITFHSITFNLP